MDRPIGLARLLLNSDAELQIYSSKSSQPKLYAYIADSTLSQSDFGPYLTLEELITDVNKEVTRLVEQARDNTSGHARGTGSTG